MFQTNPYEVHAKIFKALSDPSRLKIIEILSCGERCACDIQAFFEFTQPTLSHHMKSLMESGLVTCRKEGLWSYYGLNTVKAQDVIGYFNHIVTDTEDCLCNAMLQQKPCSQKNAENEKK